MSPPCREEGMAPGRFPMTYEEYLAWSGDCLPCEWVDGKAFVRPFAFLRHGEIRTLFGFAMASVVEAHELGKVYPLGREMRVRDRRSSRFPDILFIANDRLPAARRKPIAPRSKSRLPRAFGVWSGQAGWPGNKYASG